MKFGAATAALPLVHIRTGRAAGKLSLGLNDHWVPAANAVMRGLIEDWGRKNQVEIHLDFITGGGQDLVTMAAESRAKAGHDIRAMNNWVCQQYADQLIPMDDVMGRLMAKYGPTSKVTEYLAKSGGVWKGIPTASMSSHVVSNGRIDYFRDACGIDLPAIWPAKDVETPEQAQWDWDHFLVYAEKCQKIGKPFGLAVSNCNDSTNWMGGLFASFGAQLVAPDGTITVKSDQVHQALDYSARLCKFLPTGVFGWDAASNNKALIADQAALIFEAPSAWAVAKKNAPVVAENTWGFPPPSGPAGRFVPYVTQYWGIWEWAGNKSAGKELLEYLSQREQVQKTEQASGGYDIPPFDSMNDFPVWAEDAPPAGVWFNYPIKPFHHAQPSVAGYPAPPGIAVQIFQNALVPIMVGRIAQGGHSIDETIAWAAQELEGYNHT